MKGTILAMTFVLLIGSITGQLVDGSFEQGIAASGWMQNSTNFETPLCDAGCGNCGGPCFAFDGEWYAWFGGFNNFEEGTLTQNVIIPSGSTADLSFQFKIANAGDSLAADFVRVTIDGDMFFHTTAESSDYTDYTLVNIDISQFADGAIHTIMAQGVQSSEETVSFLMDDFKMTVDDENQTSINNLLNREQSVTMYPNPAADVTSLYFSHNVPGNAWVTIYNMSGAIVSREQINNVLGSKFDLNLDRFEAGMYTVHVDVDGHSFNEKLVVSKRD